MKNEAKKNNEITEITRADFNKKYSGRNEWFTVDDQRAYQICNDFHDGLQNEYTACRLDYEKLPPLGKTEEESWFWNVADAKKACFEKLKNLKKHDYFLTPNEIFHVTDNAFPSRTTRQIYMVFPGKLTPLIGLIKNNIQLSAADRQKEVLLFQQLIEAVRYLHDTVGKPHGNLNAYDTVFYDAKNSNIKLLNFDMEGLGNIDTSTHALNPNQPIKRTDIYKSPEDLNGLPDPSVANDMWRLGIIYFQLLTGHAPFNNPKEQLGAWQKALRKLKTPPEKIEKLFEEKLERRFQFTYSGRNFTEQEKAFIKKMLAFDPAKRENARQLLKDPLLGLQWEQAGKYIVRMRDDELVKHLEGKDRMQKALGGVYSIAKRMLTFFSPVVHAEKTEQASISEKKENNNAESDHADSAQQQQTVKGSGGSKQ